jgi:hypothetical protein
VPGPRRASRRIGSFLVSRVHNVLCELHLSSGRRLHPQHPQHPEHPAYAGFGYPYFGIYVEMPVLYTTLQELRDELERPH